MPYITNQRRDGQFYKDGATRMLPHWVVFSMDGLGTVPIGRTNVLASANRAIASGEMTGGARRQGALVGNDSGYLRRD